MDNSNDNTIPARVQAYNHLKQLIIMQKLKPGEVITENSICKQLSIGRSPVRHALQELSEEGYIKLVHNKGACVTKFTKKDLINLYEFRVELEIYALQSAIHFFYEDDFRTLEQYLKQEEYFFQHGDFLGYVNAISSFHTHIVNKAGNIYVSQTFRDIMNKISVYLALYDNFYFYSQKKQSYATPIRKKILTALRKGNLKSTQRLLKELGQSVIAAYDLSPALQNVPTNE